MVSVAPCVASFAVRLFAGLSVDDCDEARSASDGLDLMATVEAPHDEPDLGRGGVAERHRRAAIGLHGDPQGYNEVASLRA